MHDKIELCFVLLCKDYVMWAFFSNPDCMWHNMLLEENTLCITAFIYGQLKLSFVYKLNYNEFNIM